MSRAEELLRAGEETLRAAHIPSASLEAELLLARAMGIGRTRLLTGKEAPTEDHIRQYHAWLRRRSSREPLQYLIGETEFYSRRFTVRPGVAIPKPSTETLVAESLTLPFRSACDVCCGSGIIPVTLAIERPDASITAVDLSPDAIALTRDNAARHGVSIAVNQSDLLSAVRNPFDLIVSNPPYIAADEWNLIDPEVKFEPKLALDGGPDGLDVIRRLIADAPRCLAPEGLLLLEVGFRQARKVEELFRIAGYHDTRVVEDWDGIERVVGGRRP
jgi:release factor glutamine methyltransferase